MRKKLSAGPAGSTRPINGNLENHMLEENANEGIR
jgi:hypothetical protein